MTAWYFSTSVMIRLIYLFFIVGVSKLLTGTVYRTCMHTKRRTSNTLVSHDKAVTEAVRSPAPKQTSGLHCFRRLGSLAYHSPSDYGEGLWEWQAWSTSSDQKRRGKRTTGAQRPVSLLLALAAGGGLQTVYPSIPCPLAHSGAPALGPEARQAYSWPPRSLRPRSGCQGSSGGSAVSTDAWLVQTDMAAEGHEDLVADAAKPRRTRWWTLPQSSRATPSSGSGALHEAASSGCPSHLWRNPSSKAF